MDKIKVIFVSHCILNLGSKVTYREKNIFNGEEISRRKLIDAALDNNVCIVQLPCPEFNLYGANRWGSTKEQFDNPFFKDSSRKMLEPYILQIQEYLHKKNKYEILGIVGVDGSPSCGVNFTCSGEWGGEINKRSDLTEVIKTIHRVKEKGVFMETLESMLKEKDIFIPILTMGSAIKILNDLYSHKNSDISHPLYVINCK